MHVPITDESLPMSPVPIDHTLPLRGAACSGLPRSSFVAKIAAIIAVAIATLFAPVGARPERPSARCQCPGRLDASARRVVAR